MKITKILSIVLAFCIFTSEFTGVEIYANNQTTETRDVIFVLDRSGSMQSKDSTNTANELVKMYIDTMYSENTKVGLVGFNDTIVSSTELTSLDTLENRNKLKTTVNSMPIKGSTDIGLALKEATNLLEKSNASEKVIVLLSDGETDVNTSKVRTLEQSKTDEKVAIEKAILQGYTIYCIGINNPSNTYLSEISSQVGGKTYQMNSTSELYKVFENLSLDKLNPNLKRLDNIKINGVAENITLNLNNDYIRENNGVIAYSKPLKSVTSSDVELYKSNYYSSVRFDDDTKDIINFNLTSNGSTEIYMFYNKVSSLEPVISTPQKISDTEYDINVKVFDSTTNKEIDKNYYKELSAILNVETNGTVEQLELLENDNGFGAMLVVDEVSQDLTNISATVDSGESSIVGEVISLKIANSQPKQKENDVIKVLLNEDEKSIDLNKYFNDVDSDALTYNIKNINGDFIENININGNILTFNSAKEGLENIEFEVSDGNGGSTTGILSLSIMPFWIYYKGTTLIIGFVFIILLLLFVLLVRRKDKKEVQVKKENEADTYIPKGKNYFKGGRIEGYFLSTKSGKEYPALFWNENHLANKSLITLGELMSFMEVDENLMESRKIFFEATEKETITFWHRTKCVVYINNRELADGKQVDLRYDDKMYIVFEDGETEIEVRYKRVTKKSLV